MDRLDTWLNRQRGWRLVMIHWVYLLPAVVALGLSSYGEFGPQISDGVPVLLAVAGCSAVAAAPFAAFAMQLFRLRRQPLSWRIAIGVMLAPCALILNVIETLRVVWSPHTHQVVWAGSMLLLTIGVVFLLIPAARKSTLRDDAGRAL